MKRALGWLILALIFGGLFCGITYRMGFIAALVIFAATGVLFGLIALAIRLIEPA